MKPSQTHPSETFELSLKLRRVLFNKSNKMDVLQETVPISVSVKM